MTGYYVPGVKGGGPIQSIKNLVDNLSDKIDFYIITSDRDLGDEKPYSNIQTDSWIQVGNSKVYYTRNSELSLVKTKNIINSVDFDLIYLNSFFSYKYTTVPLLLRKINKISRKPVIIAPRGQFSSGALSLKRAKKEFYIKFTKALSLYKNVIWHATAKTEKEDIQKIIGKDKRIIIANNLTANYKQMEYDKPLEKKKGELKIVFISRVHPKKNLKMAIEFLKNIKGKVEFSIYGPLEDKLYWAECQKIIKDLPNNIAVSYKGIVTHTDVIKTFKQNHIFLFPTLGENFGHVISEALIGGCPIIISDQTPWRKLESTKIGWDINLKDEVEFVNSIQTCVNLDEKDYRIISKNAFNYGKQMSNSAHDVQESFRLFS
ncbi:hypothetical protein A8L44_09405 [Bacillus sp. FJAT-27986]|nr:hypothetical protein A8L44_09405 [Bacillus sp. FJAT-27986]